MPRITKTKERPPERVYLQWLDPEADYQESWEVTWWEDRIDKSDPEYIRKDLHDDELLEAQRQIDILEAQIDYYAEFLNAPGVKEMYLDWANPSQIGKEHLPDAF